MPLTFSSTVHHPERRSSVRHPNAFPVVQLTLLALVRIAEPIALTSISPYAWRMVQYFHIGRPENASFYAGILMCSFALAESFTGVLWGTLSDKIGRRPVLLMGCAGTIVSLLVVGFSSSFWMALLGRALGGLLNGNIGVIVTMVGELVTDPAHEPVAFSIMPLVWVIGSSVGPMIGGLFSSPRESFPEYFPADGVFARYPFLLPNLICAALLAAAILLGLLFIEETLPAPAAGLDPECAPLNPHGTPEPTPQESYGTFNHVEIRSNPAYTKPEASPPAPASLLSHAPAMTVLLALGIYTYHTMTYDHLLPIYLQDAPSSSPFAGGLGFSVQQTGLVLGINGLIGLVVQALVFPLMASKLGIPRTFAVVTLGAPMAYILVPFLAFLPKGEVLGGVYAALALRSFFAVLAYPTLMILVKQSCPSPAQLGTLNGLATSVGAAARTLASPLAGLAYAVGIRVGFTPLAWWVSAGVAVLGALQLVGMGVGGWGGMGTGVRGEEERTEAVVHSLVRHLSRESLVGKPGQGTVWVSETIVEVSEPESDQEELEEGERVVRWD